ncbi:DUF4148 domain-containing protein [Paraburkholderia sp. FT54]|uniref:DUF4148 domain-containing protein n=1 Tax=Paraburkholderia sp. FT54 TaxID=3074437 RepID=UPI002877F6C8|nr:DUF4148 domain-containing protein [Paraburkholderia sp. FT54]WNC91743.1 DUF4148 domain-containing protein [Paraburkholderia sp. FT54]
MMKTLVCLTLAISALASPALSFAQSSPGQLTRAEVRADLVRVEQAGYNPSDSADAEYPANIQAAEAKIAAQDGSHLANEAVGGVAQNGASGAGAPAHAQAPTSTCVGPVSFCDVFSGG